MNRRWSRPVILLAALLMMGVTGRAGFWQLDRARQKLALQAQIEQQALAPVLDSAELARSPAELAAQMQRRVRLRGSWLAEHTVFLDNRQMRDRPGFYVITPLLLAGGDAVLVQRGWVPRDMLDRSRLPKLETPAGPVEIYGRVSPWPSHLTSLGADAPGPIRQNLAQDSFTAEVGRTLRPLSIAELDQAGQAADGLWRDWPQPALDLSKHYGYAVQWFTFCAMIAGLYVWFQLLRPWLARRAS